MLLLREFLFVTLAAMLCQVVYAQPGGEVQKIRISEEVIDFGIFSSQAYLDSRIVYLINESDRDFEIESVWAGCGCISAKLNGDSIVKAMGGRSEISINLSGAAARVGNHEYQIHVIPRDKRNQPVIEGRVRYEFRPNVILLGDSFNIFEHSNKRGAEGSLASASVVLRDLTKDQSILINKVESTNPFLEFSVHEMRYIYQNRYMHHYFVIRAILAPGWPIGQIDENIIIYTNDPDHTKISLPVRGEIVGPVRVVPGIVKLNGLSLGASYSRDVVLESDYPIVLGELTSSDPAMEVKIVERSKGGERIVLRINSFIDSQKFKEVDRYWEAAYVEILHRERYIQPIRIWGNIMAE